MMDYSLEKELQQARETGTFQVYMKRARGESALYLYGEACDWDREKMIQYCLQGVSGFLGRRMFEKSFDSGRMREISKVYHDSLELNDASL